MTKWLSSIPVTVTSLCTVCISRFRDLWLKSVPTALRDEGGEHPETSHSFEYKDCFHLVNFWGFSLFYLQLFEGMKAFRGVDNKIRLFRPDLNMDRMHRSALRATLPVRQFRGFFCVSFDVMVHCESTTKEIISECLYIQDKPYEHWSYVWLTL